MVYRILSLSAAALLVFLSSCGDDSTGPDDPDITLSEETFHYRSTQMSNFTDTVEYEWTTTLTAANVLQDCDIDSGSASLTIFDADSVEIYTRSLAESGTFTTSSGMAGTWRVRIALEDLSGKLEFTAEPID